MNRRDNDELTEIPKMVPARDEVTGRRSGQSAGRSAKTSNHSASHKNKSGGVGLLALMSIVFAVAALGACYFLWEQSVRAQQTANDAEARIAGLEAQLLSTGDELSQSDAAVRVKLKDLDSEVRKLWDSRKKAIKQETSHSTSIKNLITRTTATRKQVDSLSSQMTAVAAELDEVVELLANTDLESQSANIKSATSKLQQLNNRIDGIANRVTVNEEWVESINAFRQQVNQRLNAGAGSTQPVLQ